MVYLLEKSQIYGNIWKRSKKKNIALNKARLQISCEAHETELLD